MAWRLFIRHIVDVGSYLYRSNYADYGGFLMIKNTTQDWSVGNVVKVGFLKLRVQAVQAVKDGLPDIYTLTNLKGTKTYQFIPHHGLEDVTR